MIWKILKVRPSLDFEGPEGWTFLDFEGPEGWTFLDFGLCYRTFGSFKGV